MIQIVYFSLPNHTEHTLSDNAAVFAGVNKNLKCNIAFVCESRMISLRPFSGYGSDRTPPKIGWDGSDRTPPKIGNLTGSQSVTTVTSQIVESDSGSGKIRTRANFKPLTPCSDSTMPV